MMEFMILSYVITEYKARWSMNYFQFQAHELVVNVEMRA